MNEVVLDASAIIALLLRERGFEQVAGILVGARVSAVNLAEACSYLTQVGHSASQARAVLDSLHLRIVPFDEEQAFEVARLRPLTQRAGLSLGDRACLALSGLLRLPAMTTDRAWATLGLGIEVELIR